MLSERGVLMSNRLFQGIIHQMHDSIGRTVGITDDTSTVIACSDLARVGERNDFLVSDMAVDGECHTRDGFTYKVFGVDDRPEYAVFVAGTDGLAAQFCSLMAVSLAGIKQYYDEKYDRANFIKNVILDNILPGDIYIKARELRFPTDVSRVVQNLFPDKNKDFVFSVSESDVVLVKEIKPGIESADIEKLASSIIETLSGEFFTRVNVGIGTTATGIKDLAKSFKEAQVALEVGKVFDTDKAIVNYDNLGIARLIYQLPTTLCEMFLREVFKKGSIESLDQETLFTIQKFFENNLNVSETSRKLFVHRNTLVYRLEKIKKLTGLDLREFDHAIVFKVALMVKKYLSANPVKY